MKCIAITQARTGRNSREPADCAYNAAAAGLCGIHLRMRQRIPITEERLRKRFEERIQDLENRRQMLRGAQEILFADETR